MNIYRCPDCGGGMRTFAKLTDPPIYQAVCYQCNATFQREPVQDGLHPLPRDYRKVEDTTP